jgi:DNA end-binding protein Ku
MLLEKSYVRAAAPCLVVTVALPQRTTVAVLRVRETPAGNVIVLQTMMWPDETSRSRPAM